jgi:hypothetical protein
MLLKLGELNKEKGVYPVLSAQTGLLVAEIDSHILCKDSKPLAEEIIARNNRADITTAQEQSREFVDFLIAFQAKYNLAIAELVGLMETTKAGLYIFQKKHNSGGAIKQDA